MVSFSSFRPTGERGTRKLDRENMGLAKMCEALCLSKKRNSYWY